MPPTVDVWDETATDTEGTVAAKADAAGIIDNNNIDDPITNPLAFLRTCRFCIDVRKTSSVKPFNTCSERYVR